MANWRKVGRGQLSFEKEEGRCGRTRLCLNGTQVSSTFIVSYLSADDVSAWFRLFVGDLSNDVSDDVLANAFNKYPSFQKARVIRDRLSQKVTRLCYIILCLFTHILRRLSTDLLHSQIRRISSKHGRRWMVSQSNVVWSICTRSSIK